MWARKWGVPKDAVLDLRQQMGTLPQGYPVDSDAKSEAGVQSRVRLSAAQKGNVLWRNNVGAAVTDTGRQLRYGLANESKRMNELVKSSDLIGITPVRIGSHMVGQLVGVFTAIETKEPGWKYKATDRERAQLKFLEYVIAKGGIGYFSTGVLVDDPVIGKVSS